MANDILDRFRPQVATWFREVFAAPTAVQERAWQAISADEHALVVAPTGSGKTLAAFLWALDSLVARAESGQTSLALGTLPAADIAAKEGVKVLYISPLKALGVDVENNLRAPLAGIARVAQRMDLPVPDVNVGVRSGDTPQSERSRQVRNPPDILITTPESLYLMLTSKAASILASVDTVIIDEIHALAGSKRGVHLALSLERLAKLADDPQRIGLSATVRPLETVAHFLGGDRPVEIIAPPGEKRWQLDVHVPVEDMSDLPVPEEGSTIGEAVIDDPLGLSSPSAPTAEPIADFASLTAEGGTGFEESALPQQKSIWPHIESDLYEEIMSHRSTLVFVNSRRTAERLTSRLNEIWAQRNDPSQLSPALRRDPAQLMKATDTAGKAAPVIARAHHGSVSKDERATTETMLKQGQLRAVVATSSLELGIDMGAIDLVVQVESPPSVASGLQRVGRAGHTVGAVSAGSFYPKHRADLVQTAVVVERMSQGAIEALAVPDNPLDVLTQQVVAAVAVADWDVDELYALVRRSWPYRDLDRDVFDSVIDLASGSYPSTDFADLKPRIVYDRVSGNLSARPGAQRVAVTNAGTIPDRGMFGVFLVSSGEQGAPRRVGELDEEMVYESRVGDVFTLGASSWRIENITRDQVQVIPAPGHTGRLPFWSGDGIGRPYELGKALGAFRRETHADPARAHNLGLDEKAHNNLVAYLAEQNDSTGTVPDEKTLVLERFRDELGDWRIVLHTPFGKGVNAAWALAVGAQVAERTGMDAQAVAGDDGIVLRLPEADTEPDASLFLIDPDDIEDIVTEQVGGSALFASRFRECAARALLLPRRNPGKRAPLWQQRQRAEQLLDVARKYPSFPIILETVRECLRDVYDLPALVEVLTDLRTRRTRIAEVTTEQPSPFASSLLFNYTGAFMYEGDSPLAEKRAAALALDPELLAKLLGTVELRDLLDPEIIAEVHAQLQRTGERAARTSEELADVLRIVGPVRVDKLHEHTTFDDPLNVARANLAGRVMEVRIGGAEHLAQVQDAPLLRDGLGVPVPPGVPAQVETVTDALEQLAGRWARTRGPFTASALADAFGLGAGAAHSLIRTLLNDGRLVEGRYRQGVEETEYVAGEVLKTIRSRSLAAARAQARPVTQTAFARFLPDWQQVAAVGERGVLRGVDGTFAAIEQLAGVRLPASAWESMVLPARVGDYSPVHLDELTATGEVIVVGAGKAGAHDPWLMLLPADYAADLVDDVEAAGLTMIQEAVLGVLERGGGFLATELLDAGVPATTEELREALWGLVEAGQVSPDGYQAVRARLAGGSGAHKVKRRPQRSRLRMGRAGIPRQPSAPDIAGRWSLSPRASTDATQRSLIRGETWLDRYGVLTRGSVVAEDVVGGFALAYKVLSGFEESGRGMRGYFIESLGAAQFSTSAVIDRLRGHADSPDVQGWPSGAKDPVTYVLAAADPANPYGAALAWPQQGPSRAAGALVVLVDGLLLAHITRGGRRLSTFFDTLPGGVEENTEQLVVRVVEALHAVVASGAMKPLTIEKIDGGSVFDSGLLETLRRAGAALTPKGVRIGGRAASTSKVSQSPASTSGPRRGRSVSQALKELSFDD